MNTYSKAWLDYKELTDYEGAGAIRGICMFNSFPMVAKACNELKKAFMEFYKIMLYEVETDDMTFKVNDSRQQVSGIIILGIKNNFLMQYAGIEDKPYFDCGNEGYTIKENCGNIYILADNGIGILYGAFQLIRYMMTEKSLIGIHYNDKPDTPLRMINHWDNMDGSIERGYSGDSFFFEKGQLLISERTKQYARLSASVGINAVVINNVNVKDEASYLITDKHVDKLVQMADIFSDYGITLYLSINFAAPMEIGGLHTADPLDSEVENWWKDAAAKLYFNIPKLGGFLVKADSENRPGPFTYGRTHADGANMLSRAVLPYGGKIIWRCFVYNCKQDWRDKKTDRAKAAYDNFMPLDGLFDDNVILQIKNGPMDFQVREPVSPLFGGLKMTNQILEVQIAQEYTGQQKHVCYLLPMWREVLDFHTYITPENDTVRDIITERSFKQKKSCTMFGIAGVANTGNDYNWTGHDLAATNWYGYGRLSWNMSADPKMIAEEWVRMTFSNNTEVVSTVTDILMNSWKAYENYTSPLGIGWMVNPGNHYGPNVDGYEYDAWGTYHRADRNGIGVDRTKKGTDYVSQYNVPNADIYNDPDRCPEELLLFFHHVAYNKMLKTGKTLIQHIYDTHFEGAKEALNMLIKWQGLKEYIEPETYERIEQRMLMQAEHAKEWRDRINTYFYRMSGAEDGKGRKIY